MPRFSICIPTRERHETLPYAIATVLAQTCDDFELIIQDNCSSDETRQAVEQFDDPRIVYRRSDTRLSMHANWEAALNATSGDYLLFIGDDDGLMPDCLERAAETINGRPVELLAWLAHTYYWPNVPDLNRRNHLTLDMRSSAVWAGSFAPEAVEIDRQAWHVGMYGNLPPGVFCLDAGHLLANWLGHKGARVYIPAYHNLVSRRVINRVKKMTGAYFFHPMPDFSTLIANLYVTKRVYFLAEPLSMTGHAGGSSGGTHGDPESWQRNLKRFIAESGWKGEQLLPTVFDPFLWNPAMLAGCFEHVKALLFPNYGPDVDWAGFLREAAAQVNGESEGARPICRDWILSSADKIGMDIESLSFPEVAPWTRTKGTWVDPIGRVMFIYPDCDALGLKTVEDAVNIAAQLAPYPLYQTAIVPPDIVEEPKFEVEAVP